MNKKKEILNAFKMWEHLAELEAILWDRYYDDFLDLIIEQDDAKASKKNDSTDVTDPF